MKESKKYETCKVNEYPISTENFDSYMEANSQTCELYLTYYVSLINEELERICGKNNLNFNNGTCMISYNKKIIFINWLKEGSNNISYPSYNNDITNYLLIELTLNSY